MTYALLNLIFIVPVLVVLFAYRWLVHWGTILYTLIALLLLTAVFDNFIVGSGVVAYDNTLLTGVFIGFAPIEDFAYTLVAALLIPLTWWWLGSRVKK
jgi:lycopene cyclase domain-containing protein